MSTNQYESEDGGEREGKDFMFLISIATFTLCNIDRHPHSGNRSNTGYSLTIIDDDADQS